MIGEMHPHIPKLPREPVGDLYKLAHALLAAPVFVGHGADSERVAVNHSVLPNDRLGIFKHTVKRGMRDADIHIVLIDKIRDLLRLNRAYTRNLNRIYSDGIEIGKGLFGIIIILYVIA